jgi:hypothetical protein
MESIRRRVKDIDTADRRALEHVIGKHLSGNQQVVIQVLSFDPANGDKPTSKSQDMQPPTLPEWCNVYEGLSDAEIDDIESSIVRSHGSRSFR